ncbi:alpha/beta fold hydrolase [Aeromicrobium ginsengisoli]|uniref:Alpha/beta fold hydrolase n=1 Tax=Aeromicrobium ginsengisoli TaxID=363867 RepID=A0A5M4FFS0_9ACTN|nr:alpha/beta fold hydrolase [Aeromicrobium ginsengisoli]KAA1397976.1 alpha/beta fold hydrolase [Aeromicrobium ginsengisoli]
MTEPRLTQFRNGPHTFDVIDSGPLDGTPVVLLHGFPQRASAWNQVAEHLHARGLRTYAPDQRGYSPGARPKSRFAYGMAALTSDIVALIDAIGPGPVHLVGHDWGAAVAWSVAGNHPDRVTSLTAASVPHPGAFIRSMFTSGQALKSYYMALFQLPVLPERMLASGRADSMLRGGGMTREMVEQFHTEIVDHGALRGGLGYYRSILRANPGQLGKKIAVPTTYVWSDNDVALGRKGAEINHRWVSGPYELEIVQGATHWLLDERPAELANSIIKRVGI